MDDRFSTDESKAIDQAIRLLRSKKMPESLRILMLEDNPADAELVQFELEEAGFTFTAKVVMTEKDFTQELKECSFDLILSDYDLPNFNGALALARAKKGCPETPFILVTGAVSEDRAIEILTQGAKDYVLKTRLQQRLVPAVRRALAEAEEHRARKQAEADLREANRTLEEKVKARTLELEISNRQLQALFDYSAASLVLFDAKRPYTVIAHNKYYQELWDEPFRTNGMVGKNLLDYVPAVEQSGVMAVYDEVVQTGKARNLLSFPYDGMPRGKTWWNWHLSPITRDGKVIALAHGHRCDPGGAGT
jgi:DNA-binding response OmpR family regulator